MIDVSGNETWTCWIRGQTKSREREREREEGWVKKNEENSKRARNDQENVHSREQFDGISRLEGKSCTRVK